MGEEQEHWVLIIEDDQAAREAFADVLAEAGYRVCAVDNGTGALAVLAGSPSLPCMILLDLMMPQMDGWEFRRIQRSYARLSRIPTAVITAAPTHTMPNEQGLIGVVRKPIKLDELVGLVQRHCAKRTDAPQ